MTDHEWWSASTDDRLRSAFAVLGREVEGIPFADPALVRRRGEDRRRRIALSWLSAAAAAVVAVVLAVTVGSAPPQRGMPATGPSPAPTTSRTVPTHPQLPDGAEWQRALGLTDPVSVAATDEEFPMLLECSKDPLPGRRAAAERVVSQRSGLTAHQHLYEFPHGTVAAGVAERAGDKDCSLGMVQTRGEGTWPRVYLMAEAGYQHWRVVAVNGRRLVMLDIIDSGDLVTPRWPWDRVMEIAALAQDGLDVMPAAPGS